MKDFKRIVFVSDLHCGAYTGLTPPSYQPSFRACGKENVLIPNKFLRLQQESWNWYAKAIDSLKPIHTIVPNGDSIDGTNRKQGGAELLTNSRLTQCKMAAECIDYAEAKNVVVIKGTRYHTGEEGEEFEINVADRLNARCIGGHQFLDINGVVFDIKHKISKASTALSKTDMLNRIWADRQVQPRAQVFIRSHQHHFVYGGDGDYLGIVTPALQGLGSIFGETECGGIVDYGIVYFDVYSDGRYTWQPLLAKLKAQKAQALKL